MYSGIYPLEEADQSRTRPVPQAFVDMQHRRVLGVVVRVDAPHAELLRLGQRLELDGAGDATTAMVGVAARVPSPHVAADRRKAEIRQGYRLTAEKGDPPAVVGPVGRVEPLHEILESLGQHRKGGGDVLSRQGVQGMHG